MQMFMADPNDSRLPFSMGPGMMGRGFFGQSDDSQRNYQQGPGMMGRGFFGQNNDDQSYNQQGPGMMGRGFFGQNDDSRDYYRQGPGMMGRGFSGNNFNGEPASIEEARSAFDAYLLTLANDDLEVDEVMIFDQNAYAVVVEKSTGKGAMELLLDYATGNVYPEISPTICGTLKAGMMTGGRNGAFGCGMGFTTDPDSTTINEMTVAEADARTAAQAYLDANIPGALAADEGMAFYGYYTFDYSQEGKIAACSVSTASIPRFGRVPDMASCGRMGTGNNLSG